MEMVRVRSTAISAIGYDPATGRMQVKFKQGDTYTFCRVPQQVFDSFMAANSKGAYYDRYIKGKYQC